MHACAGAEGGWEVWECEWECEWGVQAILHPRGYAMDCVTASLCCGTLDIRYRVISYDSTASSEHPTISCPCQRRPTPSVELEKRKRKRKSDVVATDGACQRIGATVTACSPLWKGREACMI